MGGSSVIDQFLNTFTTYIDSGFGLLGGEVKYLSSTLIAIDITLAGLFWALAGDEDVIARLIKKTLYIGFFAFLIGNFNKLSKIIFDSFSGLGLKAAGSGLSATDFLHPGRIAQVGLDAGKPILDAAGQLMGYVSFFENFVQIAVLMIAWAIVLISFFILAVQLFVILIEFKLTTLAGFILVPFGLFNKTSFLAERVLGNVVASGVKILMFAVITGIGTSLFSQFTQGFGGNQPTIEDALSLVLAALSLLGLGIFGPGIAAGLVSGAPQLGAGAAVGTGLAAAGIGAAGVMGVRAGAGALAGATSFAARGGATLAGDAVSAYGLAAANSGESGFRRVSAGMAGVAKAGADSASQSLRNGLSRAGSSSSAEASGVVGVGGAPDWAQRMRRDQTVSHGVSAAAHVVRSGDHGGGPASVSLKEDDH
ncbi:MAG: P-type conjugative transfer protein TrbL [Methylocella sp.]